MLPAAALLATLLGLLAAVLAPLLVRAAWPLRAPSYALVLWQAVGLAGGLLAFGTLGTAALSPLGDTHEQALRALGGPLPWWAWLCGLLALAVLGRLLVVLATSTGRTLAERRRHRHLVDLVATRNPLLPEARVVDHDVPVAYCLPGLRSRLVLSRGVVTALHEDELRAVLAHERAHLTQRHDLVVLPFVALDATFPWLPPVRRAGEEVALLVEVLADDRAALHHDRRVLARALGKVGTGAVPAGGLGAGGEAVLVRARRLLDPPRPLPVAARALVVAGAAVVGCLPLAGLVLPLVLQPAP